MLGEWCDNILTWIVWLARMTESCQEFWSFSHPLKFYWIAAKPLAAATNLLTTNQDPFLSGMHGGVEYV